MSASSRSHRVALTGRALLAALCYFTLATSCAATHGRSNSEEGAPLKVFILAGQSNMQGHADVRTLETLRLDRVTTPIYEQLHHHDGTPRIHEEVQITSIGSSPQEKYGALTVGYGAHERGPKIGPELTFGFELQQLLGEPILLIKTAWGGKSLHTDFRPPSAGPHPYSNSQLREFQEQGKDLQQLQEERAEATGQSYRLMCEHVKETLADLSKLYPDEALEDGVQLAGLVWFQGWNDMVDRGVYPNRAEPGGYDRYTTLLAQLIRDLRRDLSAPNLPVVIGVMGVGGPLDQYPPDQRRYRGVHGNFREAMAKTATLPEFSGTVAAVPTAPFWDMEVVMLRARERAIEPRIDQIKEAVAAGELTKEEGRQNTETLYREHFSAREHTLLTESTSNFDFHYMGSARTITQIGKAFAESMAELIKVEQRRESNRTD